MRILFIAPYAPSLIRVRTFHFVRTLVERGHEVVFAAPYADDKELEELELLKEFGCKTLSARVTRSRSILNVAKAAASGAPLQSDYSWSPELARIVAHELELASFSAVHVEHLRAARFGLEAVKQLRCGPDGHSDRTPVVFDSVDCITRLFEESAVYGRTRAVRWLTGFEAPRTRKYEIRLMREFDRVVTTTATEAAALHALDPSLEGPPPEPVANGVDVDYFCWPGDPREAQTIVMTGKMSYHANGAAAARLVNEVMPLVWRQRPQAKVEIVGKSPSTEILDLAYPGPAAAGQPRGEVVVTGETPDLRPHLWRAAVSVAPIVYGAGIQNKILEAMAASVPVVATANSAAAFDARAGHDLLVARDSQEIATHILALLDNADLRQRVGAAGRRYVERSHRWENSAARLESVYEQAAASLASAPAVLQTSVQ